MITFEPFALSPDTMTMLETMGYEMRRRGSIGRAAGILRTADGFLAGHADRRGNGLAAGY